MSERRLIALAASTALALFCHAAVAQVEASGATRRALAATSVTESGARVVGIDPASNSITLKRDSGVVEDVSVSREVGDVSRLRIGDVLKIRYETALLVRVDKLAKGRVAERVETETAIPASGGVAAFARRTRVLATVTRIDPKTRTVTLRDPTRTEQFRASPELALQGLKVGDTVRAEFVSATAVLILRDGKPLK